MRSGLGRLCFVPMLLIAGGCVCARPLPESSVGVKGAVLRLEVAANPTTRACGLSYRKSLAPDHGMLFVVPEPEALHLWMRDVRIPLSIAFLDEAGLVVDIQEAKPAQRQEHYVAPEPVTYAIEVNAGWFETHQIAVGDALDIDLPESIRIR